MRTAGALVKHFVNNTVPRIHPLYPIGCFCGEVIFHLVTGALQKANLLFRRVLRTKISAMPFEQDPQGENVGGVLLAPRRHKRAALFPWCQKTLRNQPRDCTAHGCAADLHICSEGFLFQLRPRIIIPRDQPPPKLDIYSVGYVQFLALRCDSQSSTPRSYGLRMAYSVAHKPCRAKAHPGAVSFRLPLTPSSVGRNLPRSALQNTFQQWQTGRGDDQRHKNPRDRPLQKAQRPFIRYQ